MSTNKTENYQLHAWEPQDSFLLREINENFAALDESAWLTAGTYEGDGVDGREIVLGFSPRAVILCDSSGCMGFMTSHLNVKGGIFLPGCPLQSSNGSSLAEMTQSGFWVTTSSYCPLNGRGTRYHYLALR